MTDRVSSTKFVEDQIKLGIIAERYPRGSKLPPERELVDSLAVSRTALREAMKSLQAQGIVSVRHGHGTFVVGDRGQFLTHPVSVLLAMGDISLEETMAARALLEPPLAALAATVRTDEQAADLMRLVHDMLSSDDPVAYEELDAAFHQLIAEISGNRLLTQILVAIREVLRTQIQDMLRSPAWKETATGDREHSTIADAVHARDPEAAQDGMRRHLEVSRTALVERTGFDSTKRNP